MAETTCVVLHPTEEQLDNLVDFIVEQEAIYPGIGICKLIPPEGWYKRQYKLNELPVAIDIPSRQEVCGRKGAYDISSYELDATTVAEFAERAAASQVQHENFKEAEYKFWKSMGKGEDPLYGADIDGTLFQGPEHAATNLGQKGWTLNSALHDILRILPDRIPGVNTTMIYVGMWRAMFAFHVEDLDLYSINYLHYGAPKSWYSILPERRQRLEAIAEGHFAADLRTCKEYLRHKTKMFSPTCLQESGLPYDTVVQEAGEFVVTFPGAYHAGFNHNFNLAEATNFATPWWLEIGKKAKICRCRPDSVYIDFTELERLFRKHLRAVVAQHNEMCSDDDDMVVGSSTTSGSSARDSAEMVEEPVPRTVKKKSVIGIDATPATRSTSTNTTSCKADFTVGSSTTSSSSGPVQRRAVEKTARGDEHNTTARSVHRMSRVPAKRVTFSPLLAKFIVPSTSSSSPSQGKMSPVLGKRRVQPLSAVAESDTSDSDSYWDMMRSAQGAEGRKGGSRGGGGGSSEGGGGGQTKRRRKSPLADGFGGADGDGSVGVDLDSQQNDGALVRCKVDELESFLQELGLPPPGGLKGSHVENSRRHDQSGTTVKDWRVWEGSSRRSDHGQTYRAERRHRRRGGTVDHKYHDDQRRQKHKHPQILPIYATARRRDAAGDEANSSHCDHLVAKGAHHRRKHREQEQGAAELHGVVEEVDGIKVADSEQVPLHPTRRLKPGRHKVCRGDEVLVQDDPLLAGVQGRIVSIQGELGRLHVKGKAKESDSWIPLSNCRVLA